MTFLNMCKQALARVWTTMVLFGAALEAVEAEGIEQRRNGRLPWE
jgi:hypothetical protein